jgi:hypothetical protein
MEIARKVKQDNNKNTISRRLHDVEYDLLYTSICILCDLKDY